MSNQIYSSTPISFMPFNPRCPIIDLFYLPIIGALEDYVFSSLNCFLPPCQTSPRWFTRHGTSILTMLSRIRCCTTSSRRRDSGSLSGVGEYSSRKKSTSMSPPCHTSPRHCSGASSTPSRGAWPSCLAQEAGYLPHGCGKGLENNVQECPIL